MADFGILAAEIRTDLANRIHNQPTHVSVNFDNRAGMARGTYPRQLYVDLMLSEQVCNF